MAYDVDGGPICAALDVDGATFIVNDCSTNCTAPVVANLSIQNNNTNAGLSSLWGAAHRLANVGVLYQAMTDQFINVQYRYVSERERETVDARPNLGGYQTIDLTWSATKLWWPAFSARAGVRNVFDAAVIYPAPNRTYPDDYPRPGRQWWLAATYKI